ncbi:uncharacterized protein LOC143294968 isoform X2 [Babylonia areolata]|uniref:uncharacterized protein LOC143294968 isoform X2 n=1 Tax=Babylonia areolata TaxID=304850 RepID=UPI003FD08ED3
MPKLGRRSEVTELDYQTSMALTTSNAPFGTEHTPNLSEKIIGGRYVSVLERQAGQNAPKYEKLSLVSDKPNHVDPRALTDFSRRYNKPYEDPFSRSQPGVGGGGGRPTNFISKRPDSKDISSRYPTLPPIDENRLKNHQISTVFEPEAWTKQFRSSATDNKENLLRRSFDAHNNGGRRSPHYEAARGSGPYGSRHSEPPLSPQPLYNNSTNNNGGRRAQQQGPMSKEEFVKKLTGMLPKNVFLPDRPVVLSEQDEMRLLQVLAEELRGHSPLKLRDIYLDIANSSDKNLSGYCQYQDLYYSMGRQMMSMPGDLLQATAAMFVSPDRPNRDVNYEKFLSFVGLALKQNPQAGSSEQRPVTPVDRQVDNFLADSEQAKLVSMVEQQLRENEYLIDFSRLSQQLSQADRTGRGVLDLRTIMDVCFQLNIPLQSSVLNRVLQRCRLNSYDDRYNWKMFVDFLQKAQPAGQHQHPAHTQRGRHPSPPPPAEKAPVTPVWRRHEGPTQNNGNYADGGPEARTEVISRMDQDIKQLERNYEDIQDKLKPRSDGPWFKNFMEFANALYNQDQRCEGDLPAEDVFKWTKMYNDTGDLGMSDHQIARALSEASKSGKVHIHTYLTKLGNVARHDKIV